jgi:hypothetical protein
VTLYSEILAAAVDDEVISCESADTSMGKINAQNRLTLDDTNSSEKNPAAPEKETHDIYMTELSDSGVRNQTARILDDRFDDIDRPDCIIRSFSRLMPSWDVLAGTYGFGYTRKWKYGY